MLRMYLSTAFAMMLVTAPSLAAAAGKTKTTSGQWIYEEKIFHSVPSNGSVVHAVPCPAGTSVTAGGYDISTPLKGFVVMSNGPSGTATQPHTSWVVRIVNTTSGPLSVILGISAHCEP